MKNVQDIYPLAPMQEAMLLHSVSRPADASLVNQFCYEISGRLDVDAFRFAWNRLVDRHPALRTAFVWGRQSGAMQVVRKSVKLDFEFHDWSDDESGTRKTDRFEKLQQDDRTRPFDPLRAPLMRILLVRLAADSAFLIWASHHLIVDRWCLGTIWSEVLAIYQAQLAGTPPGLAPASRYRDYIAWIQRQSGAAAEDFWRGYMAGFDTPTSVTTRLAEKGQASVRDAQVSIPAEQVDAARQFTRRNGVTLNTLVQGALALAVSRACEAQDTVFGVTTSGRPPDVPGVSGLIGSLVCNVPVRARLSPETRVTAWLADLQTAQQRRHAFEYVAATDIHRWTSLPAAAPLFDTLLVSLAPAEHPEQAGLRIRGLPGKLQTALPLTIGVEESAESLTLRAQVAPGFRSRLPVDDLLSYVAEYLAAIESGSDSAVLGDLPFMARLEPLQPLPGRIAQHRKPRTRKELKPEIKSGGREVVEADMLADLLRDAWCSVLGLDEIGLDDDFFDLGGDSVKAARLHAAVESFLRVSVPIISLYQAPTVGAMSELLAGAEWPNSATPVLQVREGGGDKPPLFMIASPEVNTVGYALLARHLDANRAAYVVQAPPQSRDMSRLPPSELPAMAAAYIEEMRGIQSRGPYCLLGMCTGSHLAHQMAVQLTDAGHAVGYVGVINTWAHYTVARTYHIARTLNLLKYYLGRVASLSRLPARDIIASITSALRSRATRDAEPAREPVGTSSGSAMPTGESKAADAEQSGTLNPWTSEYGWPENDPKNPKYPGTMHVFRLKRQQFWRTGERDLGWGRHAERTLVVDLPGRHQDEILREPRVAILAERLRGQLCAGPRGNEADKENNENVQHRRSAAHQA